MNILSDMGIQNKERDIFLLANNFHSIEGAEFNADDKEMLISKIQSDWKKINEKIVKNGHPSISLVEIQSVMDAKNVALKVFTSFEILTAHNHIKRTYSIISEKTKNLLIVESPFFAKKLCEWLDPNIWMILPSFYNISNGDKEIIKAIKDATERCDKIFFGLHDDREGKKLATDLVKYFKLEGYYNVQLSGESSQKEVVFSLDNALYIKQDKGN